MGGQKVAARSSWTRMVSMVLLIVAVLQYGLDQPPFLLDF